MHCFIDVTGVVNGRERDMLDALVDIQPDVRASNSKLITVFDETDFRELTVYGFDTKVVEISRSDSEQDVDRKILAELDRYASVDLGDDTLLVCSFRRPLMDWVHDQQSESMQFFDLREILRIRAGRTSPQPVHSWPEHVITEDQAVQLLLNALASNGRPLKMTGVRPALKRLDDRFNRIQNRPLATDNSKVIPFLVEIAKQRGLVTTTGPENDPLVVLTPSARAMAIYAPPPPTATTSATTVRRAGESPTAIHHNVVAQSAKEDPERPSESYLRILRDRRFGPFQEVRSAVLDEMENLLESTEKITVRAILERSVSNVRARVDEARQGGKNYLVKNPEKRMPWGQVRSFLTVMITRCPVLKNGQSIVTGRSGDLDLVVDGTESDWRIRLESELVVVLLEASCPLDAYSYEDLAGALFNSRAEVARVQDCIAHLVNTGRCKEVGDQLTLQLVS